ncbi:MAG: hypothetical protein IJ302_05785, partial [Clostridia bacterium]|nr:hypothetical protein [Clostridia bacterium]
MKHNAWTALLLLCAMFTVSCADGGAASDDTMAADTGTAAAAETEAESTRIAVEPAATDYAGAEFHIINYDNATDNQWTGIPDDIFCEEESGDMLADAVYQRNRAVEEALNIRITMEKMVAAVMPDNIRKSVMAGNTDYDAAFPSMIQLSTLINGGLVTDLYT